MKFIQLANYRIEVYTTMGKRMVRYSDIVELLGLEEGKYKSSHFVDASIITDTLFKIIYEDQSATEEQKMIFDALCIVGIYSLIDEVCNVDLKSVSYVKEFNRNIGKGKIIYLSEKNINKRITMDTPYALDDITIDKKFFLTPYSESNEVVYIKKSLSPEEFVIKKASVEDFLFLLHNNNTDISREIEKRLQSLYTKNNRDLLTAIIDINLAIEFVVEALELCVISKKKKMHGIFVKLLEYLTQSKKLGVNFVAFEGYKKKKNESKIKKYKEPSTMSEKKMLAEITRFEENHIIMERVIEKRREEMILRFKEGLKSSKKSLKEVNRKIKIEKKEHKKKIEAVDKTKTDYKEEIKEINALYEENMSELNDIKSSLLKIRKSIKNQYSDFKKNIDTADTIDTIDT